MPDARTQWHVTSHTIAGLSFPRKLCCGTRLGNTCRAASWCTRKTAACGARGDFSVVASLRRARYFTEQIRDRAAKLHATGTPPPLPVLSRRRMLLTRNLLNTYHAAATGWNGAAACPIREPHEQELHLGIGYRGRRPPFETPGELCKHTVCQPSTRHMCPCAQAHRIRGPVTKRGVRRQVAFVQDAWPQHTFQQAG